MISLKEGTLVGTGTNRACYVHPENPDKCIKVTISEDHKESWRETRYFQLLQKRSISWNMLVHFYGIVDTDLGKGMICDLPRDFNGDISKTVQYYIDHPHDIKINNLFKMMDDLRAYLLHNLIIVKDLNFLNLLYHRINEKEGNIIIIDGIGNNDFIPFATYIAPLTRKKILRRWHNFEAAWPRKVKESPFYEQQLAEYTTHHAHKEGS